MAAARVALICTPTSEMAEPYVPSYIAACDTCGTKVWVTELTGRPLLESGERVICVPCFGKVEGPVRMEDAGQVAEAEAWVLEHEAPGAPPVPSPTEAAAIIRHDRSTEGDRR